MVEAIVKGALAGLAYGLLLGPLFFLGLQVTLKRGLRNGLALAAGAFFSDALLAAGGWWSSAQLLALAREDVFQSSMGTVGALLIIGFGISAIWPQKEKTTEVLVASAGRRRYSFLKGFMLNMANPSNWLFWLGLAAAARAEAPPAVKSYTLIFLAAALALVLGTDVAKVLLAGTLGKKLKPGLPGRVIRVAGLILIGVGSWLLVRSLNLH
ncbi:MAG: LysE family transporter [Saprospiraceae bacterium]|nr:LysE family transporter [Saprospiraceae bacterium]